MILWIISGESRQASVGRELGRWCICIAHINKSQIIKIPNKVCVIRSPCVLLDRELHLCRNCPAASCSERQAHLKIIFNINNNSLFWYAFRVLNFLCLSLDVPPLNGQHGVYATRAGQLLCFWRFHFVLFLNSKGLCARLLAFGRPAKLGAATWAHTHLGPHLGPFGQRVAHSHTVAGLLRLAKKRSLCAQQANFWL